MVAASAVSTSVRVAGYSFLILFFELALIRFTSGYVRVFGFYQNFVLIATFLGVFLIPVLFVVVEKLISGGHAKAPVPGTTVAHDGGHGASH